MLKSTCSVCGNKKSRSVKKLYFLKKLEKGFIEFKKFNRQIPAPFKIYADFEFLLKGCDSGINNDCFGYNL